MGLFANRMVVYSVKCVTFAEEGSASLRKYTTDVPIKVKCKSIVTF